MYFAINVQNCASNALRELHSVLSFPFPFCALHSILLYGLLKNLGIVPTGFPFYMFEVNPFRCFWNCK